ncbi:hypothetical protein BGW36DRAFT_295523 [Talaromyces proteolyticus]|uniref:Integral membrane protein n=1 Tax=Talaromyces proteolyticus TaxID=1131652 RepID=A0AAD4PWD2_9EURO|nr:uncharacterized protein BGW36DRAFT_295523 [Talaromyces proteolyticus]KAH8697725.1 hypothetical protein BGW36DRAFT_295523 [Talaromyces proteolyticus]
MSGNSKIPYQSASHAAGGLLPIHASRPISFLNPTRQRLAPLRKTRKDQEGHVDSQQQVADDSQPHVEYLWRSRDNRKGRHAVHIRYTPAHLQQRHILPESTAHLRPILQNILRMMTHFPYWDVSYLVATIFTFGSVIWVINSFFVWLPLQDPSTEFPNESFTAGGVTAFIGASVFEIGSVLLLLEAINANQTRCFGWAVETVIKRHESHEDLISTTEVKPEECTHHHSERHSLFRDGLKESTPDFKRSFQWLPSLADLRSHYLHELGFLASLIQMIGATVFWISGFTGLPGILNYMSQGLTDGIFWVPQIAGGTCFILSGLLFTVETQPRWYIPAPKVLGWHIGFWNFIGGIGFTLCGALGLASSSSSGVAYQSSLATFWGSWCFLLGSALQWYESLQKYPVETKKESI